MRLQLHCSLTRQFSCLNTLSTCVLPVFHTGPPQSHRAHLSPPLTLSSLHAHRSTIPVCPTPVPQNPGAALRLAQTLYAWDRPLPNTQLSLSTLLTGQATRTATVQWYWHITAPDKSIYKICKINTSFQATSFQWLLSFLLSYTGDFLRISELNASNVSSVGAQRTPVGWNNTCLQLLTH